MDALCFGSYILASSHCLLCFGSQVPFRDGLSSQWPWPIILIMMIFLGCRLLFAMACLICLGLFAHTLYSHAPAPCIHAHACTCRPFVGCVHASSHTRCTPRALTHAYTGIHPTARPCMCTCIPVPVAEARCHFMRTYMRTRAPALARKPSCVCAHTASASAPGLCVYAHVAGMCGRYFMQKNWVNIPKVAQSSLWYATPQPQLRP